MPPKSKKELLKNLKTMNEYDQVQDLDGGMSSWTYNMGELNTGTTVTTASVGSLDDGLDVTFDVNDGLYQSSFDFNDEKLRNKYERLSNELSYLSLNDSIIKCIDYFMEASGFYSRIIELGNVMESLEKLKLSEELYKGWWILAKSAKKLKDAKATKKYYKKASECIKQCANNLDGDYKQSFLNKFPVRNILEEFSL